METSRQQTRTHRLLLLFLEGIQIKSILLPICLEQSQQKHLMKHPLPKTSLDCKVSQSHSSNLLLCQPKLTYFQVLPSILKQLHYFLNSKIPILRKYLPNQSIRIKKKREERMTMAQLQQNKTSILTNQLGSMKATSTRINTSRNKPTNSEQLPKPK